MGQVLENNKKQLLRKWLTGATNEEEERQLRQWAKHDPFLAEAMEGYKSVSSADHVAKVDELRGKFLKKGKRSGAVARRRVINFPAIAVAASALILIGIGTWFWQQASDTTLASENLPSNKTLSEAPVQGRRMKPTLALNESQAEQETSLAPKPQVSSRSILAPNIRSS